MTNDTDPLAPGTLVGLAADGERLREMAEAFAAIRPAIEALRTLDLGETHPAVVFRPLERPRD